MAGFGIHFFTASETVAARCTVLSKWQAVRSKTKGRTIRLLKSAAPYGTRCLDDVLATAVVPGQDLEDTTLRDVSNLAEIRRCALVQLWDVSRDLPTIVLVRLEPSRVDRWIEGGDPLAVHGLASGTGGK